MITRDLANKLMKIAYPDWLTACGNKSFLREPSQQMLDQLNSAFGETNNARVQELSDRLLALSERFAQTQQSTKKYEFEHAETYLHCGLASYRIGDKKESADHLKEAARRYAPNSHYQAVVYWLLGCIYWQLPTRMNDAIFSWELSCELFEHASERVSKDYESWYKSLLKGIKRILKWAVDGKSEPFPDEVWDYLRGGGDSPTPPVPAGPQPNQPRPAPSGPAGQHPRASIKTWPVIGSIQAGVPIEVLSQGDGGNAFITGIELGDGVGYKIISLIEGNVIELAPSKKYFILKVMGLSMNKANINDGDYVLMAQQEDANNGNIVAVDIIGFDHLATLKEYRLENGKAVFYPRSDQGEFQSPIPTPQGFRIRGVALAVLKPDDEQTPN